MTTVTVPDNQLGRIRAFMDNLREIKELEKMLKDAKANLEADKEDIIGLFAENGTASIRLDAADGKPGGMVYLYTRMWAGKGQARDANGNPMTDEKGKAVMCDNDEFVTAIQSYAEETEDSDLAALPHMTVNTASLSSWLKRKLEDDNCPWEINDEGLPVLPDDIAPYVKVTNKIDVRVRK